MAARDLQEWSDSNSVTGWEWSETNGWVSAEQLRRIPPLGHFYACLLATNFFGSMKNPAGATAQPASAYILDVPEINGSSL
jgi:hypothetical protein